MTQARLSKMVHAGMLLGTVAAITACGKSSQDITLTSSAFDSSQTTALFRGYLGTPDRVFAVTSDGTVTDFKFCVKRIQLYDENNEAVKKEGETGENGEKDVDDIKFAPGLIDVTAGSQVDWGKANIPVGFKLSKLKVKVKKDADLCQTDYSVSFNGLTTPQDIEFKWKFDPPIELDASTERLTVSLSEVTSALLQASSAGTLSSLKDRIEEVEGTGR